jgi:hypothetical protein
MMSMNCSRRVRATRAPREVAGGEGADAEQRQVEHRLRDVRSMKTNSHQQGEAAGDHADHEGVRPAHVGGAVGLDAVGDADQQHGRPTAKVRLPPSRCARGAVPSSSSLQNAQTMPTMPTGTLTKKTSRQSIGGQDAAHDQADELTGQERDAVDAEGQAALVGREGVGEDGRRVGQQERAADPLDDAHGDDPDRPGPLLQ